jgi:hypothetical protein
MNATIIFVGKSLAFERQNPSPFPTIVILTLIQSHDRPQERNNNGDSGYDKDYG